MKTFTEYLTESKKTYHFKIRIAGELPEGCEDKMENALNKYEIIKFNKVKTGPISEKPMDFPKLQNMEVTHYEAELTYPITAHILEKYLSDNIPCSHERLIVRGEGDPVEEYQPDDPKEEPYEAKLNTPEMEQADPDCQDKVGQNRIMDLLKELETARKDREIDPIDGVKAGESKDIGNEENAKSPIGS
tara:strand:+ start:1174 stop:1740 length:567 start_codon:yes stop_codon:yes gene_type:complete